MADAPASADTNDYSGAIQSVLGGTPPPAQQPLPQLPPAANANVRLTGVQPVSPDDAAKAQVVGPQAGVHPDVAMHMVPATAAQAQANQQAGVVASSPAIQHWVNTASDAAVATTQDDLASLAQIASHPFFQSIGTNFAAGAQGVLGASLPEAAFRYAMNPVGDVLGALQSGVANTILTPVSQALGRFPGAYSGEGLFGSPFALPQAESPEAATASWRNFLGLAALAGGPEAPEAEAAEAGAAPPRPAVPPEPAPSGRWPTTDAGYVATPAGEPATFPTPKAGAQWVLREGYATGTTQRFEVANAPDGAGYHVQDVGTPAGAMLPGESLTHDAARGVEAQIDAQQVADLQARVAASRTLDRSPQTMEAFLGQQSSAIVSIDPDRLVELLDQGHEVFPEMRSQIVSAAMEGSDVQVPLARYLTATAGQPFAASLNAASSFRPGAVSTDAAAAPSPQPAVAVPPSAIQPPEGLSTEEATRAQTLAETYRSGLESVVKAQYLQPLVTEANALGLTKEQLQRYSDGIAASVAEASDRAQRLAYQQVLRERRPDWQEAVRQGTAAGEQAVAARPDIRAWRGLTAGRGPLGEPLETPLKLDTQDPLSAHGKDLGLPSTMFSRSGGAPDEIAPHFGYETGADMIRGMAGLKAEMEARGSAGIADHIRKISRDAGEAHARAELGHDLSPESIRAAASELVNSPQLTDFLTKELQDFADDHGLPVKVGDMKRIAQTRFDRRAVDMARNIKWFERFIGRAWVKVEGALHKGDYANAFIWRQKQVLLQMELAEAHKFLKLYNSATDRFKSLAGDKTRASIDQDYLDAIHAELQQYDYKVPQSNLKYAYAKWKAEQEALGNDTPELEPIPARPISGLTVEDFRALDDRIENMVTLGRDAKKVTVQGRKEELAELVAEAQRVGEAVTKKPPLATPARQEGNFSASRANVELSKPEFMFDKLDDNNPNGVFNRVLMHGANDAHAMELELKRDVLDAITKMRLAIPKADRGTWLSKVGTGHGLTDPNTGRELLLRKYDLVGVALNMGSESNRWHLEEGGWGWDRKAYTDLVGRELSPAAMDFVQNVLTHLTEKLWPVMAENERALSGLAPEKVEATPIRFADGRKYAGGYFPLEKDLERTTLPGTAHTDLDNMFKQQFMAATTPKGFTKTRVGAEYPVSLDFQKALFNHINDITKRIAYGQYIQSATRFLRDRAITNLVREVHGPYAMGQLRNWLQRQVGFRLVDPRSLQSASNFLRTTRENFYVVRAGLSIAIAFEHASTLGQLATVGGEGMAARGYGAWAAHPLATSKFAMDSSAYMRNRQNEVTRELRDISQDLIEERRVLPKVPFAPHVLAPLEPPARLARSMAHFFLSWVNQYTVAVPAWTGAYNDAIAGTAVLRGKPVPQMEHDDAVRFADKIVSEAHGSGAEKDMSQFQSGYNDFFRLMNLYYQYHGSQLQLTKGAINLTVNARSHTERAEGFRQGFWSIIFAPIVAGLVTWQEMDKLFGSRANSATRAEWFADRMISGLTNEYPGVREVWQSIDNRLHKRPWEFELSPVESEAETIFKASEAYGKWAMAGLEGHSYNINPAALEAMIEAPGYFLGIPTGQPAETVRTLADTKAGRNPHPIASALFGPSREKQ